MRYRSHYNLWNALLAMVFVKSISMWYIREFFTPRGSRNDAQRLPRKSKDFLAMTKNPKNQV